MRTAFPGPGNRMHFGLLLDAQFKQSFCLESPSQVTTESQMHMVMDEREDDAKSVMRWRGELG